LSTCPFPPAVGNTARLPHQRDLEYKKNTLPDGRASMSKKTRPSPFAALTWDDLEAWAGSSILSRGRSYQRSGRVRELAHTASGGILAWVQGTFRYATRVEVAKKTLVASCTCPYGGTCKHAVAVVLAYLECLKQQSNVPTITTSDRRLRLLEDAEEAEEEDDYRDDIDDEEGGDEGSDFREDDEEADDDEEEDDEPTVRRARPGSHRAQHATAEGLSAFLEQQSKEDLLTLLKEQIRHHPEVRQAILDRADLLSGEVKKLVRTARQEINKLCGSSGWDDDWGRGGGSGNYDRIRMHLEALLAAGHADEVISLGQELLEAGTRQVEMIHDEGETGIEISACMKIVFRALPRTSLSSAEQMLWAIGAELDDEYDLCHGAEVFWQQGKTTADWNSVAEQLAPRLQQFAGEKGAEEFSRRHRRDRLSNWLIRALEHAGRSEEVIPLCEREAEKTESYVRLVNYLKQAERWKEVEHWIHKGIAATQRSSPGIADQLRTMLRERREQEKNWLQAAAFYAEDFFRRPGAKTFQELEKAAKRAGVAPAVRAAALHYLETGVRPQAAAQTKKSADTPSWPLPDCEVKGPRERQQPPAPMTEALIDIAIAEKRPDEVVRWDDQRKQPQTPPWGYGWGNDDRIAEAIADAYPDRAIAIWKATAEAELKHAQVRAYETAAVYLRKVRRTLKKQGQEQEWKKYLAALRQANLRRPRLVEILDSLQGRPIVET
jgi:uncharacterized Zn finger protein